jgi:hypothetical protein
MVRTIALTRAIRPEAVAEALRTVIVCGCAIALIAAGHAFPVAF